MVVVCNVAALWAVDYLVDGVAIDDFWRGVVAGAVLGLVNMLVRPVVKLLALPLIVLTLGVALFFVNLGMLALTAWLSPGFTITGFWPAAAATVVVWLVNTVLYAVFGIGDARRRRAG